MKSIEFVDAFCKSSVTSKLCKKDPGVKPILLKIQNIDSFPKCPKKGPPHSILLLGLKWLVSKTRNFCDGGTNVETNSRTEICPWKTSGFMFFPVLEEYKEMGSKSG